MLSSLSLSLPPPPSLSRLLLPFEKALTAMKQAAAQRAQ